MLSGLFIPPKMACLKLKRVVTHRLSSIVPRFSRLVSLNPCSLTLRCSRGDSSAQYRHTTLWQPFSYGAFHCNGCPSALGRRHQRHKLHNGILRDSGKKSWEFLHWLVLLGVCEEPLKIVKEVQLNAIFRPEMQLLGQKR